MIAEVSVRYQSYTKRRDEIMEVNHDGKRHHLYNRISFQDNNENVKNVRGGGI